MTPPTCASLLQPQPLEHLAELVVLADVGQLDVHAGAQPGAQVGRTGEHVAQVLVPHELVAALLEQVLDLQGEAEDEEEEEGAGGWGTGSGWAGPHLGQSGAEASEHLPHVAPLLHADDPQVVLLVDPHQEGLVVVVPAGESDTHTHTGEQRWEVTRCKYFLRQMET